MSSSAPRPGPGRGKGDLTLHKEALLGVNAAAGKRPRFGQYSSDTSYNPFTKTYTVNTNDVVKSFVVDGSKPGLEEMRSVCIVGGGENVVEIINCPKLTTMIIVHVGEVRRLSNLPELFYLVISRVTRVTALNAYASLPKLTFLKLQLVKIFEGSEGLPKSIVYLSVEECGSKEHKCTNLTLDNMPHLVYLHIHIPLGRASTYMKILVSNMRLLIAINFNINKDYVAYDVSIKSCPNLVNIEILNGDDKGLFTDPEDKRQYTRNRNYSRLEDHERARFEKVDPGMKFHIKPCVSLDDFVVVAKYMFRENTMKFYFCEHIEIMLMAAMRTYPEPVRNIEKALINVTEGSDMYMVYAEFKNKNDPLSDKLFGKDHKNRVIPAFCVAGPGIEEFDGVSDLSQIKDEDDIGNVPRITTHVPIVYDLWTSSVLRRCGVGTRIVNSLKPWRINGILEDDAVAFWKSFGIITSMPWESGSRNPPMYLVPGTEENKKSEHAGDFGDVRAFDGYVYVSTFDANTGPRVIMTRAQMQEENANYGWEQLSAAVLWGYDPDLGNGEYLL